MIKESFIYRMFVCLSNWLNKIFSESFLMNIFVRDVSNEKKETETIFVRLINKIIEFLRSLFVKLKLDRLLDNSIFTKPIIWLSLLVGLTPFLPTMLCIALLIFTGFTLVLKILTTPDMKLKYFRSNIWIMLFLIVIGVSAATSISLEESMNIALVMIAFVLAYFIIINTIETKKQFKSILYIFVITAGITAIIGIYQYVFGDIYSQAWLDSEMFEDIKMRVYSTFENPNVYGEYLILAIPIAVSLFWTEKGLWKKAFLLLISGTTMLAIILTFSRGCWLGILFALAILAVIIDRRFIILGLIGLMMLPFVLPDTIINRFMSIGDMSDSSTSYRVYIWMGTIAMLKDYWFSGIGLGITSFNTIYPMYSYNNISAPHSHNLYLQLTVEYGIIGLIIFAGIIYNFYKETVISMIKEKNIITAGIIAGITGFLIQSMFDHTWYNYRVVLIFWMIIALGIVSTKLSKLENN